VTDLEKKVRKERKREQGDRDDAQEITAL